MKIYTIDANNDASRDQSTDTGWLDTSWLAEDTTFNISGTWAGFNIALDVSHEPYKKGTARTKYSTVATYIGPQNPLAIPRRIGGRIRFRRVDTGAISGQAFVGVGDAMNPLGQIVAVSPESTGAP